MSYLIYILFIIPIIATPGPGILMTINNSLHFGLKYTILSIFGISIGMLLVSSIALFINYHFKDISYFLNFTYFIGGCYLLFLSIASFKNKINLKLKRHIKEKNLFVSGILITLTNPKAYIFFISLFPLFISDNINTILLSLIFSIFIIIIHLIYSYISIFISNKINYSNNIFNLINKLTAFIYLSFSLTLFIKLFLLT